MPGPSKEDEVDEEDSSTVGAGASPKRRTRKIMQSRQATPNIQTETARDDFSEAETKSKRSRSRKRRTEITPMKLARGLEDSGQDSLMQAPDSPSLRTQGAQHLVGVATNSPALTEDPEQVQDIEETNDEAVASQRKKSTLDKEEEALRKPMIRRDSQIPPQVNRNDEGELTPDPTDEHQEFDSILESEGFSMVSVSSSLAAGNYSNSPGEQNGGFRRDLRASTREPTSGSSPSREKSVHGYSDISSMPLDSPEKPSMLRRDLRAKLGISSVKNSPSLVHGYSDISSMPPDSPEKPLVLRNDLRASSGGPSARSSPLQIQSVHGYSDISSMPPEAPSSNVISRQAILQMTPSIALSPSLPATPQASQDPSPSRPLEKKADGTPRLTRIVRAATALQGLPSPAERVIQSDDRLGSPFHASDKPSPFLSAEKSTAAQENSSRTVSEQSPAVRVDKLFNPFGGGTRRELRAGLRLGEELAKRQESAAPSSDDKCKVRDDPVQALFKHRAMDYPELPSPATKPSFDPNRPDTPQEDSCPELPNHQLPSPAESVVNDEEDGMSWKADTEIQPREPVLPIIRDLAAETGPTSEESSTGQSENSTTAPEPSYIDHTLMAKEAEWQREREAVSKQIQTANTSQVVVINSDDPTMAQALEEDDSTDVLIESECKSPAMNQDPQLQLSNLSLQPEVVVKPRRSKLPSPWRRCSQIYSDDPQSSEPSESDLFWQPDQAQAKAAKKRQERKRQAKAASAESLLVDEHSADFIEQKHTTKVPLKEASILSETSGAEESAQVSEISSVEGSNQVSKVPSTLVLPEEHEEQSSYDDDEALEKLEAHSKSNLSDTIRNANIEVTEDHLNDDTPIVSESEGADTTVESPLSGLTFIDPELLNQAAPPTIQTAAMGTDSVESTKSSSSSTLTSQSKPTKPALTAPSQPPQSSSWLTLLSRPITTLFTATPTSPSDFPTSHLPPATRTDILCSSKYAPLSPLEWTYAHYSALETLYTSAFLYGPHIFPYSRRSASARYKGRVVSTATGWSRIVSAVDCGVADAFMVLLEERSKGFSGIASSSTTSTSGSSKGGEKIDSGFVVRQCVAIWTQMVMRGEVEPEPALGEVVGRRKQGDRLWTKEDIDWAKCQKGYFERKRREFERVGLPSWREKGLVGGRERFLGEREGEGRKG